MPIAQVISCDQSQCIVPVQKTVAHEVVGNVQIQAHAQWVPSSFEIMVQNPRDVHPELVGGGVP
mgnify:CR=1 FL=1